jgi:nucleoside-diphosphate-sugar epimerase
VSLLLERGYAVCGTVRDTDDSSRTEHLHRLAEKHPGELELLSASLLEPGSFDAAVSGAEAVLHMASPVLMQASDPQREIVDPAIRGTRNVFDSIERTPTVAKVVMTSSIAAIRDETIPPRTPLTEETWNESASLEHTPYPLAKTLAERDAWSRAEALRANDRALELITINPTIVLGPALAPIHARGSLGVCVELLRNRFPGVPRLSISIVDVRDVARAHVEALERTDAHGRYILFNESLWVLEIADILRRRFPERRLPRRVLPDWMMYVAAMFDRRLSWHYLRTHLGVRRLIDNAKARRELELSLTPIEDTLVDTARSLLELGLV